MNNGKLPSGQMAGGICASGVRQCKKKLGGRNQTVFSVLGCCKFG
jgi:hypothetical protein